MPDYTKHEETSRREQQKATRFSDEKIRDAIEDSIMHLEHPDKASAEHASAYALLAQTMIAYNTMINNRWEGEWKRKVY